MEYITLSKQAFYELTEKRSKFLGFCTPVQNEEEAIAFINSIKEKHKTATHNVYAYSIKENNTARYSDDGEPQGTAGLPILEVIKKEGLQNICIVVTRYFGGTLLGTGGLVRAYSQAAKECIALAGKTKMQLCDVLLIECEYSFYNSIHLALINENITILDTQYSEGIVLLIAVKKQKTPAITENIRNLTSAKAKMTVLYEEFEGTKIP